MRSLTPGGIASYNLDPDLAAIWRDTREQDQPSPG
jgi:hypothetical protein